MEKLFYVAIAIFAYVGLIKIMKDFLDYIVDKFNK
jgi:hypothetical protein